MTSREKVLKLRERLQAMRPADEEQAQMLQLLALVSPLLMKALPDDPALLDRYLQGLAVWATECRSDEAPIQRLFEWDGEASCFSQLEAP